MKNNQEGWEDVQTLPWHFPTATNVGSLIPTRHLVPSSQTCLAAHNCRAIITAVNLFLHLYLPAGLRVNPAARFGGETVHITVVSLPLYSQTWTSAQLAVIKAAHYSLLLHSSITAPARLILHSCESKKDREHKFNSGNVSQISSAL